MAGAKPEKVTLSFEVLKEGGEYDLETLPGFGERRGDYLCSVKLTCCAPSPYPNTPCVELDSLSWGICEVRTKAYLKRQRNVDALFLRLKRRFEKVLGRG